jgi:hypothetical membrane protein
METLGENPDSKLIKIASVFGLAAPIAYVASMIIGGLIKPYYDPLIDVVSAIGEGGDVASYVMNFGGFFLCGVCLLIFAFGLSKRIGDEEMELTRRLIPIIVGVSGFGFVLVSFFPLDSEPWLHNMTTYFASFITLAPLFSLYVFRKDKRWTKYWTFTLLVVVATLTIAISLRYACPVFLGLRQRMAFAPVFLWIEAIAFRLHRLA